MAFGNISDFREILSRVANHKDYRWSIASSYAHMLLNIVVQILLVPLYLHYLGKVQFGVLMIVLASINYLGLGLGWASSGAQRIMGEKYTEGKTDELQRVFGLSKIIFFFYAALLTSSGVLVVWGADTALFPNDPVLRHDVIDMLLVGIVYVIVLYDLNVDRLLLMAIGKQAYANILSLISLTVFAILTIVTLMNGGGLVQIMGAQLLGALCARGVSYFMLRRLALRPRFPQNDEWQTLRRLLGPMGIGYGLYGALLLTLLQADTLLLGLLLGAAVVADYVLIWKIADVAMQALWRLPESLTPYLVHMDVKGEHQRMRSIYFTARRAMFALAGVVGLAYAVLGPYIVQLWVGPENAPDAPWAYVLAGGALFWMVVARLPAVFAYSTVKLKPLVHVTALETILKIGFVLISISTLGLYAPLIAINIIHIFGVAILYQKLSDKCGLGPMDRNTKNVSH